MEGTFPIDNHLKFLQKKSQRSTVIFYIFKKLKREKLTKRRFFVDFSAARGRSELPKDGCESWERQTDRHPDKPDNNTNLSIS
jgi:hypothetical protein